MNHRVQRDAEESFRVQPDAEETCTRALDAEVEQSFRGQPDAEETCAWALDAGARLWQIVYCCCCVCCFFCPCWVWCDVVEATWIWALIVFLAIPLHLREPCLLIAARTQRYRPPLELGHFFLARPDHFVAMYHYASLGLKQV